MGKLKKIKKWSGRSRREADRAEAAADRAEASLERFIDLAKESSEATEDKARRAPVYTRPRAGEALVNGNDPD